jgi:hypothetical protein
MPQNPLRNEAYLPDPHPLQRRQRLFAIQPELRSFRERLFSRGGAGNAEGFLEIAEPKGFALSPLQLFRWNFRFRVQVPSANATCAKSP